MTPRNATLFLIIGAVVVGGGIWLLLGSQNHPQPNLSQNPTKQTTSKNPTSATSTNQKSNDWLSKLFSMPSFENLAPNFTPPSSPNSQEPTNDPTSTSPETNSNFSPLRGKIRLSQPHTPYSSAKNASSQEYFSIQIDSSVTQKIPVTGLIIKSAITLAQATIGQGVYLYFSGTTNPLQDIFLGPGEIAYVVTGRSPLGVSFRVNKCLGYLTRNQNFTPSLYSSCPAVRDEPLPAPPNSLNDKCLDYIENLSSCTTYTTGKLELSPECNSYLIEKANYSYCSRTHKNDKDFYKNEWRIYLSRDETLWKNQRETIELLDQNGKLIDSVSY